MFGKAYKVHVSIRAELLITVAGYNVENGPFPSPAARREVTPSHASSWKSMQTQSTVNRRSTRCRGISVPKFHRLDSRVLGLVAREDVDMGVVRCCRGDHQAMGMESRHRNGRRSVAEKSGVGLEVRHRLAIVDVEDLYPVSLRTTEKVSMLG